jgi:hypothetical protein
LQHPPARRRATCARAGVQSTVAAVWCGVRVAWCWLRWVTSEPLRRPVR